MKLMKTESLKHKKYTRLKIFWAIEMSISLGIIYLCSNIIINTLEDFMIKPKIYEGSLDLTKGHTSFFDEQKYLPEEVIIPEVNTDLQSFNHIIDALNAEGLDHTAKVFEDKNMIDDITSQAKRYVDQAVVNPKTGICEIDEYKCIALGNAFGNVGDTYKAVFKNGDIFNTHYLIKCEDKNDDHTKDIRGNITRVYRYLRDDETEIPIYNENNQLMINVVEFICDLEKIPANVSYHGNYNYLDEFKGELYSLEKIGHYDLETKKTL